MNTIFLSSLVALLSSTPEGSAPKPAVRTLSPPPLISVWSPSENPSDVAQRPAPAVAPMKQGIAEPAAPIMLASAKQVALGEREPSAQAQASAKADAKGIKPSSPFILLGVSLDAGIPDFAGANVTVRPFRSHWFRVEGGVFSPGSGLGVRGGVTFVPFHWGMRLTFTGEGGHYFKHDANNVTKMFGLGNMPDALSTAISSVSYSYANAHAGLEFGSQNFGIFLRGGLSYVDFTFDKAIAALPSGDMGTFSGSPVSVRATLPTLKLGMNFYFL